MRPGDERDSRLENIADSWARPKYAAGVAEIRQFAKAVVQHWVAGITGGIVGVAVTLSATLFHPLPKHIVVAAIFGYLIFAAFYAWREQYQRANRINKPLELRDRLDSLAKQGERLLDLWMKHQRPIVRSGKWNSAVEKFAREHFKLSQFDAFTSYQPNWEEIKTLENQLRIGRVFQDVNMTEYAMAILIARRLNGLKILRGQITDES